MYIYVLIRATGTMQRFLREFRKVYTIKSLCPYVKTDELDKGQTHKVDFFDKKEKQWGNVTVKEIAHSSEEFPQGCVWQR